LTPFNYLIILHYKKHVLTCAHVRNLFQLQYLNRVSKLSKKHFYKFPNFLVYAVAISNYKHYVYVQALDT